MDSMNYLIREAEESKGSNFSLKISPLKNINEEETEQASSIQNNILPQNISSPDVSLSLADSYSTLGVNKSAIVSSDELSLDNKLRSSKPL